MRLHEYPEEFENLCAIVAEELHLRQADIRRDYYMVLLLENLANSEYAEQCVFKGGTSLIKCYPGSIERFSEDIDLTFLGMDLSDKDCDRAIKKIESAITRGCKMEKIAAERSNRSKSSLVWFGDETNRIKLEIGSSVRPDPYSKMTLKSYIQEFLERNGVFEDIAQFNLREVTLNVLNIERTFLDKVMAVKRHAICGTLPIKVRHIYDVTRLFRLQEIERFLCDTQELKRLIRLTKETDSFYLGKRGISQDFDPEGPYAFDTWRHHLTAQVKDTYESLHKNLLYTEEQQDFNEAVSVFKQLDDIFKTLGE